MTPEQVYSEWRSSLKSPDDSLFYYHPNLERILLGLSIYAISSRPLVKDLGKAESLRILNIYITDLITAWIDEDDDAFKTMFDMTMTYTLKNLIIGSWTANLMIIPKTRYFIASPFSDRPCKIAIKTVNSPKLIAVNDDKYKTFEPS